jgi:hypothetical protein
MIGMNVSQQNIIHFFELNARLRKALEKWII